LLQAFFKVVYLHFNHINEKLRWGFKFHNALRNEVDLNIAAPVLKLQLRILFQSSIAEYEIHQKAKFTPPIIDASKEIVE